MKSYLAPRRGNLRAAALACTASLVAVPVRANGVTVQGLPHHTGRPTLDAAGNEPTPFAQGEEWRFRLPDGSVWSADWRTDFFTVDVVGPWSFAGPLGPVCHALAG